MDKKERLLALIDHFANGNKTQFAGMIGVSPQGLSTWISRDTFDTERIYSKCVGVSPHWLLTGEGPMLENDNTGCQRQIEPAHHVPDNVQEGIPLIPLSAMAGAFTGETSVMEYECERYVIPAFKGADFLIQVKGDSMQPTYYSGDLVACQRVPLNDLFFQWNKTYVLDTAQGPLIKRIMPGSDSSHVLIVSDNDSYPPFELSKSQFHGVALVRGLVRLE
jgi:phage repressor protein C with HTH and peptisase S24 domain